MISSGRVFTHVVFVFVFLCELIRENSNCLISLTGLPLRYLVHYMMDTTYNRHMQDTMNLKRCVVEDVDHHSNGKHLFSVRIWCPWSVGPLLPMISLVILGGCLKATRGCSEKISFRRWFLLSMDCDCLMIPHTGFSVA